jgi:hypothetical protein
MYWFYDILSLNVVCGGAIGRGIALQAEGGLFDGVIEIFPATLWPRLRLSL